MIESPVKLVLIAASSLFGGLALQITDLTTSVKEIGLFATAVIVFLVACYGLFKYFAARLDKKDEQMREERKEFNAQWREMELLRHQDNKELRDVLVLHNEEINGLKGLLEALTNEVRRKRNNG